MNKFEELLAKYGKTADEVTFEYENLSDEELEVAFKEAFEETDGESEPVVEETVVEDEDGKTVVEETVEEVVEETTEVAVDEVVEQPEAKFVLKYELSHDDIRSALYSLLATESDDGYYCTWILEVFDDKFIYYDCVEDKYYRQNYIKDGENVALGEDKVEVFNEWLSKAEKDALDTLKADYASLKAFKDNYDATELKAQKADILNKAEYACLVENTDFAQLVADIDNYSVEEIATKADLIFAAHMKSKMDFCAHGEETHKPKTLGFSIDTKSEKKKKAYGNLFND